MFASETVNALPLSGTGFSETLPIFSEQVKYLPAKKK